MHPHSSAQQFLPAHAAIRGEIALLRSPLTPLPLTTAMRRIVLRPHPFGYNNASWACAQMLPWAAAFSYHPRAVA